MANEEHEEHDHENEHDEQGILMSMAISMGTMLLAIAFIENHSMT